MDPTSLFTLFSHMTSSKPIMLGKGYNEEHYVRARLAFSFSCCFKLNSSNLKAELELLTLLYFVQVKLFWMHQKAHYLTSDGLYSLHAYYEQSSNHTVLKCNFLKVGCQKKCQTDGLRATSVSMFFSCWHVRKLFKQMFCKIREHGAKLKSSGITEVMTI